MSAAPMLEVEDLAKSFTLHTQGGVRLPVLDGVTLRVFPGECVILADPSGAGKSTLLRAVYGNYLAERGRILVRHRGRVIDLRGADPRAVLDARRHTVGYVSQFLRVVPRVPTLDVVAEPLRARGTSRDAALARGRELLTHLGIPERLWGLSPMTFSGGEQQRVNVARGFIAEHPLLLLDEPTASLDLESRRRVVALIEQAKTRGAAIVATVHDQETRDLIATRIVRLHEDTRR
jgi:alpha-D-ribose 1-methylphosphonate 5-triphosphate synthase subunit PhnL